VTVVERDLVDAASKGLNDLAVELDLLLFVGYEGLLTGRG
jgi:hypothetical protein